eukprot:1401744-Pleurochrysis_carterae.AAC.3
MPNFLRSSIQLRIGRFCTCAQGPLGALRTHCVTLAREVVRGEARGDERLAFRARIVSLDQRIFYVVCGKGCLQLQSRESMLCG